MQETRPEFDAAVEVCGETYHIRRTHDLLRRMEQRFGGLIALGLRVERFAASQAEIASIYEEIVKGEPTRPSRSDIERWVWEEGTPKVCVPLAKLLYELPIGNRTLRLLEEERMVQLSEQLDAAAAGRPTSPESGPAADRMSRLTGFLAEAMTSSRGSAI